MPVPQKPRRWVHDGLRRELPTESQEAFEARVKRSAFWNLLQNEEWLCLNAMIAKLGRRSGHQFQLGEYGLGCYPTPERLEHLRASLPTPRKPKSSMWI